MLLIYNFNFLEISGVARVQQLPGHLMGVSPPQRRGVSGHSHLPQKTLWGILFSTCTAEVDDNAVGMINKLLD